MLYAVLLQDKRAQLACAVRSVPLFFMVVKALSDFLTVLHPSRCPQSPESEQPSRKAQRQPAPSLADGILHLCADSCYLQKFFSAHRHAFTPVPSRNTTVMPPTSFLRSVFESSRSVPPALWFLFPLNLGESGTSPSTLKQLHPSSENPRRRPRQRSSSLRYDSKSFCPARHPQNPCTRMGHRNSLVVSAQCRIPFISINRNSIKNFL